MRALEEVALGAEKSRRAAWAQVYEMRDRVAALEYELAKYKQAAVDGWDSKYVGTTYVTARCHVDGCAATVGFYAQPLWNLLSDVDGANDDMEGWTGHLHAGKASHFGPCPVTSEELGWSG